MAIINAFVGRSFHADDDIPVQIILRHLNTFKSLGFEWEDAEEAESASIASKVKKKFENKNVFIGIFTRKYPFPSTLLEKINPKKKVPWIATLLKLNSWASSAWTFQESGYAIAKGLIPILIVENGIPDIGGLQGDIEFIPFSRDNVGGCFTDLSSVINKIIVEKSGFPAQQKEPEPQTVAPVEKPKPEEEASTNANYHFQILQKLFAKEEAGAEVLFSDWLSKAENEEKKNNRRAMYQDIRRLAGYSNAFDELEKLSRENPSHYLTKYYLAEAYEDLKQHDKASALFSEAEKSTEDKENKVSCIVSFAKNLCKLGKSNDAIDFLEKKIIEIIEPRLRALFFDELSDIYKELALQDIELACLEKAVYLAPSNHHLRFKLAYKYGDLKKSAQSLFHYDILSKQAPDGTNLNNLGVAYAELKMNAESINAYKRAANLNETLAMANLANKLISNGFIEEAKEYLKKARSFANPHQNASTAEAKIAEMLESEIKRREEVLKNTNQEREFRLSFADALAHSADSPNLSGKWKTPHGDLNFKIDKTLVRAAEKIQESSAFLALINPSFTPLGSLKDVTFSANLHNRTLTGAFTIRRDSDGKGKTSILGAESPTEYKILGIVASDSLINIMQTNSNNEITFLNLEKYA